MLVSCAINVNFQNSLVTEKYTKTEDYVLIESMKQKKIQKKQDRRSSEVVRLPKWEEKEN
jgi:hypothetical protein